MESDRGPESGSGPELCGGPAPRGSDSGRPEMSYPGGTLKTGGPKVRDTSVSGLPAVGRPFALGRLCAALAASLLLSFLTVGLPASPAFSQSRCSGVTVVVDFGSLAAAPTSTPATGCAADPADGLDALVQAGFSVTEVASIRGMVCRIDELPDTDCGAAPPAKEYWSYWHAEPGDSEWTYSIVGGAGATPDAGDLEGWVFGDGSTPPATTPADAAATTDSDSNAESDPGAESNSDSSGSLTWIIAVAALALIAALVVWRLRRDRRA